MGWGMLMGWIDRCDISVLTGKTLSEITRKDDELLFVASDGAKYRMYHYQDCCECVEIEDICGDLEDLIGSEVLQAEEVSHSACGTDEKLEDGNPGPRDEYADSYTWTFYKLATVKGSVTIRWYGSSNGCYSEGVDFEKVEE